MSTKYELGDIIEDTMNGIIAMITAVEYHLMKGEASKQLCYRYTVLDNGRSRGKMGSHTPVIIMDNSRIITKVA